SYTSIHQDTSTSALYTLSLHDALPILRDSTRRPRGRRRLLCEWPHRGTAPQGQYPRCAGIRRGGLGPEADHPWRLQPRFGGRSGDRKSTRLNSSHVKISYAVFCLKKKK